MGGPVKAAPDFSEVEDEALEANFRKRITPEIVEWMRRKHDELKGLSGLDATSDAAFGAIVGTQRTLANLLEDFERLLSESLDTEFR